MSRELFLFNFVKEQDGQKNLIFICQMKLEDMILIWFLESEVNTNQTLFAAGQRDNIYCVLNEYSFFNANFEKNLDSKILWFFLSIF